MAQETGSFFVETAAPEVDGILSWEDSGLASPAVDRYSASEQAGEGAVELQMVGFDPKQ